MKNLLLIILLFPLKTMAQLVGTWQGQMTYNAMVYPATMDLRVAGQRVSGRLTLNMNGVIQSSRVDAQILTHSANRSASGQLTDGENNVANILFGIVENQLNVSVQIGAPNGGNLVGSLVRVSKETLSTTGKSSHVAGNLLRDPNLIGRWSKLHTYTSGGLNTEEYWDINADGTLGGAARSSASSYGRDTEFSFNGGWTKNEFFEKVVAAGARWFTRNNMFFYQMPDGSEKFSFYYKIEHYDGRINLFLRTTPDQKIPARFTRIQ